MIECNCGASAFKIVEIDEKVNIMCEGCARVILETKKENLDMTGFKGKE